MRCAGASAPRVGRVLLVSCGRKRKNGTAGILEERVNIDDYERKLSPFGRFVFRTERRIRHYELRAKLAEAKTRAAASKAKVVRKGRSRRPGKKAASMF